MGASEVDSPDAASRGGPGAVRAACWVVRDTGLAPAPGPFRRLGGAARHHRASGEPWPHLLELEVAAGELRVAGVGAWPLREVSATLRHTGPPLMFVVEAPGASQLLATTADERGEALLAALGQPRRAGRLIGPP